MRAQLLIGLALVAPALVACGNPVDVPISFIARCAASTPSADSLYCGKSAQFVPGAPRSAIPGNAIYRCSNDGSSLALLQTCDDVCSTEKAGTNDHCGCDANALYCGSETALFADHPNNIYRCVVTSAMQKILQLAMPCPAVCSPGGSGQSASCR